MRDYYVYITSSISKVLYIGITNNIDRRIFEHKNKITEGFSSKYNCDRLVYLEIHTDPDEAIAREKQLKRWNRAKKLHIITLANPKFDDLSIEISRLRSK